MLNDRQERFCKEYIVDCNQTQAYIRAGYCPRGADRLASRLMRNDEVRARVAELMAEKDAELIAKGDEVLKYLTAVLRGETEAEVVVVEGTGEGYSDARCIKKGPDEKERLKAAELLGKRYGLYTDVVIQNGAVPVTIVDDVPESANEKQKALKNDG